MSKRWLTWLAIGWLVTLVVSTGWVSVQTDGEVTIGNALLVGVMVATLLVVAVATLRRK